MDEIEQVHQLAPTKAVEYTLERLGWQLMCAEVDSCTHTARIELKRFDGTRLTLDHRNGRTVLESMYPRTEYTSYRGLPTDNTTYELLGRYRFDQFSAGLRALSGYVADNNAVGTIQAGTILTMILPSVTIG